MKLVGIDQKHRAVSDSNISFFSNLETLLWGVVLGMGLFLLLERAIWMWG